MARITTVVESTIAAAYPSSSGSPPHIGVSAEIEIANGSSPGKISKQVDTGWDTLADAATVDTDLDDLGFSVINAIIFEVRGPGAALEYKPAAVNGWAPIGTQEVDGGDHRALVWSAGRAVTGSAKVITVTADGALSYRVRILGA